MKESFWVSTTPSPPPSNVLGRSLRIKGWARRLQWDSCRSSDVCWLWCEAGAVVGFGESENSPIYWHNSQLKFYPHCSCWWGSTYYQSWETECLWPKYIVPICLSVRQHPNAVVPWAHTEWARRVTGESRMGVSGRADTARTPYIQSQTKWKLLLS